MTDAASADPSAASWRSPSGDVELFAGDCREVMRRFPENHFTACVTDPPYDLTGKSGGGGFMGKKWDGTGVAFDPATWREVLRVLKPGAFLLAFGGTRTSHRLACAIEDAGFEIRDSIGMAQPMAWVNAQGFPKSMAIGKSLDAADVKWWLDMVKAVDNADQSAILEAWKEHLETASNAGLLFAKNEIATGTCMSESDFVPAHVMLQANPENSDAAALLAELNSSEARHTPEKRPIAPSPAAVDAKQDRAKFAASQTQNVQAKPTFIGIAQFAAKGLRSERMVDRPKAVEALKTWLGSRESSIAVDTNALCAALTADLKHIILNQSETYRNADTTRQTVFASAIVATITESTGASLISFMADTARREAIDKADGAEREVVGRRTDRAATPKQDFRGGKMHAQSGADTRGMDCSAITAPASALSRAWDGYGTALKPAWEPCVVAMKPLDPAPAPDGRGGPGTFVANLKNHGVAGINVDGCRLPIVAGPGQKFATPGNGRVGSGGVYAGGYSGDYDGAAVPHPDSIRHDARGRWPANVVLVHHDDCREVGTRRVVSVSHHPAARGPGGVSTSGHGGQDGLPERPPGDGDGTETAPVFECHPDCPVRLLDEQSGERPTGSGIVKRASGADRDGNTGAAFGRESRPAGTPMISYGDTGCASRFFFCAKADGAERRGKRIRHPTVKPLALVRWLVRMVTYPGDGNLILDPFAGSCTTMEAARAEHVRSVGIDMHTEHLTEGRARLEGEASLFSGPVRVTGMPADEVAPSESEPAR